MERKAEMEKSEELSSEKPRNKEEKTEAKEGLQCITDGSDEEEQKKVSLMRVYVEKQDPSSKVLSLLLPMDFYSIMHVVHNIYLLKNVQVLGNYK